MPLTKDAPPYILLFTGLVPKAALKLNESGAKLDGAKLDVKDDYSRSLLYMAAMKDSEKTTGDLTQQEK